MRSDAQSLNIAEGEKRPFTTLEEKLPKKQNEKNQRPSQRDQIGKGIERRKTSQLESS